MILGDRDKFVGFHVTSGVKKRLVEEAARRHKSVSLMISEVIDEHLPTLEAEEVEAVRSNKRSPRILIRAVPGHSHTLDAEGRPTCGCHFEEDVPLPFDNDARKD